MWDKSPSPTPPPSPSLIDFRILWECESCFKFCRSKNKVFTFEWRMQHLGLLVGSPIDCLISKMVKRIENSWLHKSNTAGPFSNVFQHRCSAPPQNWTSLGHTPCVKSSCCILFTTMQSSEGDGNPAFACFVSISHASIFSLLAFWQYPQQLIVASLLGNGELASV